MRKRLRFSLLINLAFLIFIAVVIYLRAPGWIAMYQSEGEPSPQIQVKSLGGDNLSLPDGRKRILVFWATWCGPCSVELGRLNTLVKSGKIDSSAILAISIMERPELVESFVGKKGYVFPVALDASGDASRAFRVNATPTIAFINEKGKIEWLTMGLSPTLEVRALSFLKVDKT